MRHLGIIAALVAFTVAGPALARGTSNFNGLRVEGTIGWDRLQNQGHRNGLSYGVGAGYDLQGGNTVMGLETEFGDSTAKKCGGLRTSADPRICDKATRDIYIGGRAGKVINNRSLIYAKIGYDNSRVKTVVNDRNERVSLRRNSLDGVRIGAGLEYALGSHSFIKAEYRHTNSANNWSRNQVVSGLGVRF